MDAWGSSVHHSRRAAGPPRAGGHNQGLGILTQRPAERQSPKCTQELAEGVASHGSAALIAARAWL